MRRSTLLFGHIIQRHQNLNRMENMLWQVENMEQLNGPSPLVGFRVIAVRKKKYFCKDFPNQLSNVVKTKRSDEKRESPTALCAHQPARCRLPRPVAEVVAEDSEGYNEDESEVRQ